MSVRDHHNPFLKQKRLTERANRMNARKQPKRLRTFVPTRATLRRALRDAQAEFCPITLYV